MSEDTDAVIAASDALLREHFQLVLVRVAVPTPSQMPRR